MRCRNRHHMKNHIKYKGNINNTSVIIFFFNRQFSHFSTSFLCDLTKTPSNGTLLGRICSKVFLMLVVVFHFVVVLHSFPGYLAMPPAFHPGFSGPWRPSPDLSSTLATFDCLCFFIYCRRYDFRGIFYTQVFFLPYVASPNFWFILRLWRPPWEPPVLPWSLQGFIWSSKYKPGPSVCLIHSNPETSFSEEFAFKFYEILYEILVVKVSLSAPYSFWTLFACSKYM